MPVTQVLPTLRPVEAVQWNGTDARADELWEWTSKAGAVGNALPTRFMVLGEDDAYDALGDRDIDGNLAGDEVGRRVRNGYSAVVYNPREGVWLNMRTGDWVLHHPDGRWTVISDEGFRDTFTVASEGGS